MAENKKRKIEEDKNETEYKDVKRFVRKAPSFSFDQLPFDLQVDVLKQLDLPDLCRFAETCSFWHDAINNHQGFWRKFCNQIWPTRICKAGQTWKDLLRYLLEIEKSIRYSSQPGTQALMFALHEAFEDDPQPASLNEYNHGTFRIYGRSSDHGSIPHWLYVTFGLTELASKVSSNLKRSGWGFELTFRLAKTPQEIEENAQYPPFWPLKDISQLVNYVNRTGNCFLQGDHIPSPYPLGRNGETPLRAFICAVDPELKSDLRYPFGQFKFIQLIGLTQDELDAGLAWDKKKFIKLMTEYTKNTLQVTQEDRKSVLEDHKFVELLKQKSLGQTSTQNFIFSEGVQVITTRNPQPSTTETTIAATTAIEDLSRDNHQDDNNNNNNIQNSEDTVDNDNSNNNNNHQSADDHQSSIHQNGSSPSTTTTEADVQVENENEAKSSDSHSGTLILPTMVVPDFVKMVRGRIMHHLNFTVYESSRNINFQFLSTTVRSIMKKTLNSKGNNQSSSNGNNNNNNHHISDTSSEEITNNGNSESADDSSNGDDASECSWEWRPEDRNFYFYVTPAFGDELLSFNLVDAANAVFRFQTFPQLSIHIVPGD